MKENKRYLLMHKYLSGQATASEKEELHRWQTADPEHREIFDEVKLIWDIEDFGGDVPQYDPDGLARLQGRIDRSIAEKEERKKKYSGKYWKIIATICLLIVLGLFAWLLKEHRSTFGPLTITSGTRHMEDRSAHGPLKITSSTRHSSILLPDGSKVSLNESSSLVYKDSLGKRISYLKGEAWFEVSKDENSPFYIYMEDAFLKVLGTSFNVNAYEEENIIEVVVTTGSVAFSHGSQRVKLLAGEKGVLDKRQLKISKTENQDPNFDAWKTGKLQFRNARLDVILKTLENYYSVSFYVKDNSMLSCRFTGTFTYERVEEVLKVLAFALNINYQYTGEAYSISGNGCNQ